MIQRNFSYPLHGLKYVTYLETNVTITTSKWSSFSSLWDSAKILVMILLILELQRDSFIDNRIYVCNKYHQTSKLTI